MIIVNFSHPFTGEHLAQLEAILGEPPEVVAVPVQLDLAAPTEILIDQVMGLVEQVGLTPKQWFQENVVINLPGHNLATALILAELHGRMGYWPSILRMRPAAGVMPARFEVTGVIDLAAVRASAADEI